MADANGLLLLPPRYKSKTLILHVRKSDYIEDYPLMPVYRGDGSRSMAAPGLECDAILIGDLRI